MNPIAEDLIFETNFRGTKCEILIEAAEEKEIHLDTQFMNKETSLTQAIINVIIKDAFRETDLK